MSSIQCQNNQPDDWGHSMDEDEDPFMVVVFATWPATENSEEIRTTHLHHVETG